MSSSDQEPTSLDEFVDKVTGFGELSEIHSLLKEMPKPSKLKDECPSVAILFCERFLDWSDEKLMIECLTLFFEEHEIDPLHNDREILRILIACDQSTVLEEVITKWPSLDINSPMTHNFMPIKILPIDYAIQEGSIESAVILLRNFSNLPQSDFMTREQERFTFRNKKMLELFLMLTYLNFWNEPNDSSSPEAVNDEKKDEPSVNFRANLAERLVDPSSFNDKIYSEGNLIRSACISFRKSVATKTQEQILAVISNYPIAIQSLLKLSQVSVENLELKDSGHHVYDDPYPDVYSEDSDGSGNDDDFLDQYDDDYEDGELGYDLFHGEYNEWFAEQLGFEPGSMAHAAMVQQLEWEQEENEFDDDDEDDWN